MVNFHFLPMFDSFGVFHNPAKSNVHLLYDLNVQYYDCGQFQTVSVTVFLSFPVLKKNVSNNDWCCLCEIVRNHTGNVPSFKKTIINSDTGWTDSVRFQKAEMD